MQRKNIITNMLLFAFIITSILGCNMSKLKSGYINGEQQSLILLSNNFIKNSFQVRLIDAGTLTTIGNTETVIIASNKKVIDMEGHFTNKFTISNGIINFAIDPNESISASDTLRISIVSNDNSNEYFASNNNFIITKPGKKILLIPQVKVGASTAVLNAIGAEVIKSSSVNASNASTQLSSNFQLFTYILSYQKNTQGNIDTIKTPVTIFTNPNKINIYGSDYYHYDIMDGIFEKNDVLIGMRPDNNYTYSTTMTFDSEDQHYLNVVFENSSFIYLSLYPFDFVSQYFDPFYTIGYVIPKTRNPLNSFVVRTSLNSDFINCQSGLNFSFSGLPASAFPNFLYTQSDNSNKVIGVGIANPFKADSIFNTGEMNFKNGDNYIDFFSTQYDITPSHAKFSAGDCNKTINFAIKPKPGLTKVKLVLKLSCENSASSLAPNVNLELINNNSNNILSASEPFSIENGISVLYLDSKSNYEMKGEYGGKKFDFNFSFDANILKDLISKTLNANPELKDFSVNISNGLHELDIVLNPIYKTGACPF
jgi:hypothetical protein